MGYFDRELARSAWPFGLTSFDDSSTEQVRPYLVHYLVF